MRLLRDRGRRGPRLISSMRITCPSSSWISIPTPKGIAWLYPNDTSPGGTTYPRKKTPAFSVAQTVAKRMMKKFEPDFVCLYARGRRIPHTHLFLGPNLQRRCVGPLLQCPGRLPVIPLILARLKDPEAWGKIKTKTDEKIVPNILTRYRQRDRDGNLIETDQPYSEANIDARAK